MYKRYFKRLFDFFISLVALICLSPVLLVVYLLLTIMNKGAGAIFFQERPGKDGKIFRIIKFKTMTDECTIEGDLLPDIDRLTKVGNFVRSTSIDELPQLINVFKGDMALIGPRPLLPEYLPRYSPEHSHRHDIRPGITGWAQVNGRTNISWKEKLDYDIWYVNHVTLPLDLKIIFMTIRNVIKREDVILSDVPFENENV